MSSEENPVVDTEYGQVKGLKISSELGFDYFGFQGIPYMKQPLGKLRFREAQPPEKWNYVLDATQKIPSYVMTSFMTKESEGQENAAIINVFTKNLKPVKKLPVMVWIHGGAFCRGSSGEDMYNPDFLFMQADIVFVSFNYRLGAIGFLSLNDPKLNVPGNNGLKDQVFALEWVKRNIANFGGNVDNVTIMGESAGSASVHHMCITPRTRGLFHRAIMVSGCALNKTWTVQENRSVALARQLGWKGDEKDERSLLEFLEEVPAIDMDKAIYKIITREEALGYGSIVAFGPCVEPYMTEKCVVTKDTVEMAREAWTNEIDIIVVGCSSEGLLFANLDEGRAAKYHQENPEFYLPLKELNLKPKSVRAIEAGKKIEQLYYNGDSRLADDYLERYYTYCADFHFWHGLYRVMLSRRNNGSGKTYLVRFDVDGELNIFKKFVKNSAEQKGACHADDLFYMFKTMYYPMPSRDTQEFRVIDNYTKLITSFVSAGEPSTIENVKIALIDDVQSLKCSNITLDGVANVKLPELDRLKVWNSVFTECGLDPIKAKL